MPYVVLGLLLGLQASAQGPSAGGYADADAENEPKHIQHNQEPGAHLIPPIAVFVDELSLSEVF
jgi:hypothetical protein